MTVVLLGSSCAAAAAAPFAEPAATRGWQLVSEQEHYCCNNTLASNIPCGWVLDCCLFITSKGCTDCCVKEEDGSTTITPVNNTSRTQDYQGCLLF